MAKTGIYLRDHPNRNCPQYRSPRRQELSGVIVVHTAENPTDMTGNDSGAENVAHFIGTRSDYGSYHTLVDADSIIRMVDFDDEAFHDATSRGNHHEIGISAAVSAHQWNQIPADRRWSIIDNLAQAAAEAAKHIKAKRGIDVPARLLTRAESERRIPGFISHALRDPARRSDPGRDFPWALFFERYLHHMGKTARPTTPTGDLTVAQINDIYKRLDKIDDGINALRGGVTTGVAQDAKNYGRLAGALAALRGGVTISVDQDKKNYDKLAKALRDKPKA